MIKRMSQQCYKVYVQAMTISQRNLPVYLNDMYRMLNKLDEILTEYEQNDIAFTKEYTSLNKQWSDAEKSFYKMLRRWCKCNKMHQF